jgi:arylsulfatase A-like enzyme
LLICTDQQFAGAMSCTGNPNLNTPALDRMAAQGVRFDNCYCAQPLCVPSRAAMFHGHMPHVLGVGDNQDSLDSQYVQQGMGWLLGAAGYHCAYGGKWHVGPVAMPEQNQHGFERIAGFNDNLLADACLDFFRRDHSRPWLLVASFDNPHNICEYARNEPLPWAKIDEPPLDACPNLPPNFAIPPHEPQILRMAMAADRRVWPTLEYTVGQWRRLRNAYYRLCEFADREIGRILAGLEAAGLAGDTVILFTSDHGDGHGAHRWNQKWVFYEESARVPFIVIDPQAPAARRGQVDHHLINNGIDLLPTVLDYAGAPVSDALPGHSVRPLVSGEPIVDWPDQTIGETTFGMLPRKSPGRMVRTARYKYCVYSWGQDREQLFDLALDPGEMVDLTVEARYRDVLANHRERLRRWCQETHDPFLRLIPD